MSTIASILVQDKCQNPISHHDILFCPFIFWNSCTFQYCLMLFHFVHSFSEIPALIIFYFPMLLHLLIHILKLLHFSLKFFNPEKKIPLVFFPWCLWLVESAHQQYHITRNTAAGAQNNTRPCRTIPHPCRIIPRQRRNNTPPAGPWHNITRQILQSPEKLLPKDIIPNLPLNLVQIISEGACIINRKNFKGINLPHNWEPDPQKKIYFSIKFHPPPISHLFTR